MSELVVDYAFSHPNFSDLTGHSPRIRAVGRYVSENPANDGNGKNLIPSENDRLKKAGIGVVLFAEEGAQDMLGGFAAGKQRAQHFDAVVKALGRPNAKMFCPADFDATPAQQTPINNYLDGVASVIGRARTWMYGGYYPVSRALNAGKCAGAAQTFAWSRFSSAGAFSGQEGLLTNSAGQLVNLLGTVYTFDTEHDQEVPLPNPNMAGADMEAIAASLPSHAVLVRSVAGRALPGTFLYDSRAGLRQGLIGTLGGGSVDFDEAVLDDFGQDPAPAAKPTADTFREWVNKGGSSLQDVADAVSQPPATILRQTVVKYGKFDDIIYAYLNGLANGTVKPTDKIPAGGRLWVKA